MVEKFTKAITKSPATTETETNGTYVKNESITSRMSYEDYRAFYFHRTRFPKTTIILRSSLYLTVVNYFNIIGHILIYRVDTEGENERKDSQC